MATGGWVAELDKEEHKNWVKVGCALNIAEKGITQKIQNEMNAWCRRLISSPLLQSLPTCTCPPGARSCATCVKWKAELIRLHRSKHPNICWKNSDEKQWGSPTGAWEIAKVFMPTLGSRKSAVVNAETTDIDGLLNLLEWCPFINRPVNPKVLSSARDECRNRWAHAPKQELQKAVVSTIFDHLNSLLNDPVFIADKVAQKASNELQDLSKHGLVNVRDFEIKAFRLLRRSLVADLTKCQDEIADAKEQGDLNREEIGKLRQQFETTIQPLLNAVDDFNRQLNKRDDLGKALDVIHDDVEEIRNTMQNLVFELKETQSQVANLESNLASLKCNTASNEDKIFGLQRDVMEVMEELDALKRNTSQGENDDNVDMRCTAPRRLTSFTGRKSALEWLKMNVVSESPEIGHGTSCCIKTICGLGGCGKTSLAVEFAWRFEALFPGGVFWINGESDKNIRTSVVEMLALVNIAASTTDNIDDTLNRFLAWLSKKERPWLLVVDNADELQDSTCPTGIKKICRGLWQRNVNASKHGHILLTTRQNVKDTRTFLRLSDDECLELQCFSEEEGVLFLTQKTGLKGEVHDREAILLVKELGALPLALEQAASFMSSSSIELSFKEYLEEYQEVQMRLMKQQSVTALSMMEAQHRLSVHTTWEMNFASVEEESPAAASLMRIAAFLPYENIPFDIINPGFPELDQEELRKCARSKTGIAVILKVLSRYSLFSVNDQTRVFRVHKLVREAVRDRLTVSQRREAMVAATRLLEYYLSQLKEELEVEKSDYHISLKLPSIKAKMAKITLYVDLLSLGIIWR